MSSRNFRRRNHRRRNRTENEPAAPLQQARDFPECPICNKPVRELPTALSWKATGTPVHFDCVLKELKDTHELLPQEKLCYLGGGTFGILQFRTTGSNRFTIKKKIPYEDKDSPQEWKKTILIPN